MPSFLDAYLHRPQALSYYANQVKKLRSRHQGVTIEIAQIRVGDDLSFIAGINSSAKWQDMDRALLKSWGVTVVEPNLSGKITLKDDGGALHAEENMAAYIQSIGGRGLRWSRAVVGACFETKGGTRSYVCHRCRAIVERVGGVIEPPF
jgi:hypothetical protein